MKYTAKKLGDLAGISVRTLHWYDKIGLLKPCHVGDNGYRYYGRRELYLLQQILFFRELDFGLDEIREIIYKDGFDKIDALEHHRKKLGEQLHRTKTLMETIELTILDLKGGKKVHDKDLYKGFFLWADGKNETKVHMGRLQDDASSSEKLFIESAKDVGQASWTREQWDNFGKENDRILSVLADLEEKGESPDSADVHSIIKEHYDHIGMLHDMNDGVYLALADLIITKAPFRKQIDAYGKDLPEFLNEAMLSWLKSRA